MNRPALLIDQRKTFIATIFVPLFFKWLSRGKLRHPTSVLPKNHAAHQEVKP